MTALKVKMITLALSFIHVYFTYVQVHHSNKIPSILSYTVTPFLDLSQQLSIPSQSTQSTFSDTVILGIYIPQVPSIQ